MRFTRSHIEFLLIVLVVTKSASAITLCVGEHEQFSSVRTAISVANFHDTIIVKGGIYKESNLSINIPISIIGTNTPLIDAGNRAEEIFLVTADDVHISGFILQNVGVSFLKETAAIRVSHAKAGSLSGNIIKNCYFGIYLAYAVDYIVQENQITGNITDEASAGNAIHVWKGSNITISGNVATDHRDGIYFEFVDNSTIRDNKSRNNLRYGLHFMFSNNDAYLHNEFSENGAGVAVMFSKKIEMRNNAFLNNWGGASYGLLLKEISDASISGNRFFRNTIGILAEGTNRLLISKNQFIQNGTAMDMKGNTLDSRIIKNNFIANTFEVVTNSRANTNTYEQNYWSNYKGYDLDRNGEGDVAYRPVNVYAKVTKEIPAATVLLHSFFIDLLDAVERLFPTVIPAELVDKHPLMNPVPYDRS